MQKAIFKSAMLCLTSRMSRLRLLLLLVPVALLQVGCSDTTPQADNVDSNGQAQSAVPWNRPESWETQGQLGGMTR